MEILKKTIIIIGSIVGVLLLIIAIIGGKYYMDQKELEAEMLKVVKSKEAKKVFEEGLKNLDPKAFTEEGVIQSYEIDYKSIRHNPMGGIMVNLIINHNPKLKVYSSLNKYGDDKLEGGGGGNTNELEELLVKEKENSDE